MKIYTDPVSYAEPMQSEAEIPNLYTEVGGMDEYALGLDITLLLE